MKTIFCSKYYSVVANEKINKYLIINKITNIVEDTTSKLPSAIGLVKASEAALLKLLKDEIDEKGTD